MKKTNFRWIICSLLFFATTVNYLDRQVLSLTYKDFIAPIFGWSDEVVDGRCEKEQRADHPAEICFLHNIVL